MISAPEIERALLGKALDSEDACSLMLSLVGEDDFYNENHKLIFTSIRSVFTSDAPLGEAALRDRLNGQAHLVPDIIEAAKGVKDQGIEVACQYLVRYRKAREFSLLCQNYARKAKEYGAESDQLFAEAGTDFFNLLSDELTERESHLPEIIDEETRKLYEPIEGGIKTGLDLDNITQGFRPGNLVVLAGKTAHGKSSLAHHLCLHISLRDPVALVTMEMTKSEIIERFYANMADVPYQAIRNRQIRDRAAISEAKKKMKGCRLTIIDKGSMDIDQLYATARRLKLQKDISVLVVDYLQQIISKGQTREREVARIMEELKRIAQDLDIVVIALSQFNRETKHTTRPKLHQLRESGAIEQWANTAILLWNPMADGVEYFPKSDPPKWSGKHTDNIVELIVAKNRGGKTGSVKIGFQGGYQRFHNLVKEPEFL